MRRGAEIRQLSDGGPLRGAADRVGAESYASRLTAEAQANGHRVARGEMMRSLDRLIKFIGVALIPIGAVLIWKQHWVLELSMKETVDATVAALIGMIPEGLYLLTSVALAVSMMYSTYV